MGELRAMKIESRGFTFFFCFFTRSLLGFFLNFFILSHGVSSSLESAVNLRTWDTCRTQAVYPSVPFYETSSFARWPFAEPSSSLYYSML